MNRKLKLKIENEKLKAAMQNLKLLALHRRFSF